MIDEQTKSSKGSFWRELPILLGVAIIGVVGAIAVAGFDQSFEQFHRVAFENELWRLDSTRDHLIQMFPEEFWRQVVDRVAQEVPDTLLLAEAFWLMEGYFVRTLGMHRVYNSAFMNMLRDEKNQEYRLVIKNTIEFDPEISNDFTLVGAAGPHHVVYSDAIQTVYEETTDNLWETFWGG